MGAPPADVLSTQCPKCSKVLRFRRASLGKKAKCPVCGSVVALAEAVAPKAAKRPPPPAPRRRRWVRIAAAASGILAIAGLAGVYFLFLREPKIGGRSRAEWTAMLDDPSPGARAAAADAISRMGADAAPCVPRIIELLRDPDEGVCRSAAEALVRLGPAHAPQAGQALVGIVRDPPDGYALYVALLALEKFPDALPPAVSPLIDRLRYPDDRVRCQASLLLGRVGRAAAPAVPTLARLLEDRDTRVDAAVALHRIEPSSHTGLAVLLEIEAAPASNPP